MQPTDWFLTTSERGNPATMIDSRHADSWTDGNVCRVLVHGATYFRRLRDELSILQAGDDVSFTDWRSDADERLVGPGTE
ncbi:MAG: phospholipase, partial [Ilumatobacteraceae bacterium]